ncbi:hypothetical protein CP03DC29_0551B, partial [Chlamydia psittaci 03DC29]
IAVAITRPGAPSTPRVIPQAIPPAKASPPMIASTFRVVSRVFGLYKTLFR